MKSSLSNQTTKCTSSNNTVKAKKSSKDREKRKSSGPIDSNSNDKGSPSKDSKQYAGVSSDSISIYAEQYIYEHLSEEVCNTLTEDINYKLRYIVHDALLKARLSGRNIVLSEDIQETFKNLSIAKVYGPPTNPIWVPFGDQNLLYLDDTKINLIELAEEDYSFAQHGKTNFIKSWYPDSEPSQVLKNYFITTCQAVISTDEDLRKMALKDISENPHIGPIIEWFYHFGYFLLMKDITCDCLTIYALNLIEILENSPLGSTQVSVKQLKLLVRLLLQRLLISVTSKEALVPMCSTLAILCLRDPLKEMVIAKINQKLGAVKYDVILPILTIIYFLGLDGVKEIFLPNICYFLEAVDENASENQSIILAIYGLICRAEMNNNFIEIQFRKILDHQMVIFWKPLYFKIGDNKKMEINLVKMKIQLTKTRRKVDVNIYKKQPRIQLGDVFQIPLENCRIKSLIIEHQKSIKITKKEVQIVVGKTSLLLSILNQNSNKSTCSVEEKCLDHSLKAYCF